MQQNKNTIKLKRIRSRKKNREPTLYKINLFDQSLNAYIKTKRY
jgi:hypothetical protein